MKKSDNYAKYLITNITYGINLSFNRLIDEKRKNNEEFVFMKDGKIVYVNAHDVEYRKLD